jgi:hypothetical protein
MSTEHNDGQEHRQSSDQPLRQKISSILVADCGTIMTKAVLLEQVEGSYRFVARGESLTTVEAPWLDITLGVQHAVEQIEDTVGRALMDQGYLVIPEEEGNVGVDAFVALVSAAQPLRVILAGLVDGLSLASAERAASGTYTVTAGTISMDPAEGFMYEEDQIQLIASQRPEVVCIVGGTDGGATVPVLELVEAAAIGCSLIEEEARPRILYAGNKILRKRVVNQVAGRADIRPTENVRPATDFENLEPAKSELEMLYTQRKLDQLAGGDLLTRWGTIPPIPTAKAFSQLIQYLWHLDESPKGILGIDVGAAHTTTAAVFNGQVYTNTCGRTGTAFGGQPLVERRGVQVLSRWVPFPLDESKAREMLVNREVRPWAIPQEQEDLWLDQAVAREAIREALRVARPGWNTNGSQTYPHLCPQLDPILLSGKVLAGAPRPGQAALIALDAIEPIGVTTLLLDVHNLAPALGGIARLKPLATVEALDNGAIANLATVIAPVGNARKGDVILRVRVSYEELGEFDLEVTYGTLEVLPLAPGQEAVIDLRPRRRFDVGMGGPGRGGRTTVQGGLVGLIIDARGRPLRLPRDPARCQAQIQRWLWDVGG